MLHKVEISGTPLFDIDQAVASDELSMEHLSTLSQVIFKGDHMYHHHLFRINYTTYDVLRAQDNINPWTDHCDIMMLVPLESTHPFLYARILGIFHANVIYTSSGFKDYIARCLEFLWVGWFETIDVPAGWEHMTLDSLKFIPMTQDDAYGFIDPTNILRGCHLIPAFASGRKHPDGVSVSWNARDGADWKHYYINR